MPKLEIIGAPQSNFVRVVRIAAQEKGVPYELIPARPHTPEVDAIHPFGKIPVMRHGALTLCESKAMCTYIDLAFDGPPLIPREATEAARCEQWISLVSTEFDPAFARGYMVPYFFSGLPDGAPDRARIEASLPRMRTCFGVLDRHLAQSPCLAGPNFTLADAYLVPLVHYLSMLPESSEMLREAPHVSAWFGRMSGRASVRETVPPEPPKRT